MKEGWTYKKLGEVCDLYQPKTISTKEMVADGMYDVFGANGVIGKYNQYNHELSEILMTCRGATCGNINVSTPKSWINGNAMVIHIKDNSVLEKSYLVYALSHIDKRHIITGAAQPQITRQTLAPLTLSYPSIQEQQRIVSRLDAAFAHIDELKANAEKQLSEARILFQKALAKAMESKKGWEEKKMGDVCEVNRGRSKHRPRNDKRLYGGNYPFIQTGDIHCAHGGILKSYSQTYSDFGLAQSRLWKKGTICITIAANIGETAILGMDACFPDSVVGIFPNEVLLNAYFLNYYLVSIKEAIDKLSYGTAQKNINLEILNNLIISFPPLSEQQRIVSRLDAISAHIRELEDVLQKTIAECDALKQALLRKVFE